jgi:hypothetical protein
MAKKGAENTKGFVQKKHRGKLLPGLILVTLGSIFLLNNYGLTTIDIGKLWPLFLIIPGVLMLFGMTKDN